MDHQPSDNQPLVIVAVVVAALVVILVIALALSSGGGSTLADDRGTPDRVLERVTRGLQANDPARVWNEMSPEFQELFPLENWRQAVQDSETTLGRVTAVRIISPPKIRTETGWDGQWADAEIEIVRERKASRYLVRFVHQDGQWWLAGTSELN